MLVPLSGFVLFFASFLIHLCFWRIRIPKHQIRTLFIIFLLSFLTGVATFVYFPEGNQFIETLAPRHFPEFISLTTLFMSLTAGYYFLFAGLIDEGPSVTFILNIAESRGNGLDKHDLESLITKDAYMKSRIKFLVDEKLASKTGERYVISKKGILFLKMVNKLRKWMNVSIKVG